MFFYWRNRPMSSTLLKKLRLKETDTFLVIAPPAITSYFEEVKPDHTIKSNCSYHAVFITVETLSELYNKTHEMINRQLIALNGRLLIAYPKKGNKLNKPFLHRDDLFPTLAVDKEGFIQGTNFKFNQMVSLDENYTVVGIKQVNKESRQKNTIKPSQCIADYEHRVPDVIQLLTHETNALDFYQQLTPGYQKGWARYIFSAKQAATQSKRLNDTIDYLNKGIKAKHLAKK